MKRVKRIIVFIALLVIVTLTASCGSGVSLSASMSSVNEPDETSLVADEYEESEEIEEDDSEYFDDDEEGEEEEQEEEEQAGDGRVVTVVLNTNKDRKRIHILGTSCSKQIHKENYQEWEVTVDELVEFAKENGYVACGRCHPDTKLGIDLPK